MGIGMRNEEFRVLIITGGYVEDALVKRRLAQEAYDMVIAADHGLDAADRLHIVPDYILGDFDSAEKSVLEKYRLGSTPMEKYPVQKDKTDTQIAIETAILHHATYIELIGATGSRLDHTMANLSLLLIPLQRKIDACIIDSNNKIYLKKESFYIEKNSQYGNFVSLLPFDGSVKGLTLKGFQYPLQSYFLSAGSSVGISNEIVAKQAFVEFDEGILAVFETRDE
jgi:thiamine pyrophosphokinase